MALLTSCQNTFQSVVAYEDALCDVETLKFQVHECYSEITKTSNEIMSSVKVISLHDRKILHISVSSGKTVF